MSNNKNNNNKVIVLRQNGFTLFEVVIVVLLVGVLMSVAIDRMLKLQVDAERVTVEQTIGALQSAVNLQAAEMVINSGLQSLRVLENTNPMRYLQKFPHNYVGEHSDRKADDLPSARWYFDDKRDILGYTIKNKRYFVSDVEGVPRIRLKVELVREKDIHGRDKKIQGIAVTSLHDYHWKLQQ